MATDANGIVSEIRTFLIADIRGYTRFRVGNYAHNPQWGLLLEQLWVR